MYRFLLHEEGLFMPCSPQMANILWKNKQTRIPISGDPEAPDSLAAIILLTTSSVTVPAKSRSVSSQRCESDHMAWCPGMEWSFDDCTEYSVNSSIAVWKRSAISGHLKGHLLGEALPDFMFWAKSMSPLLCTLGTVLCHRSLCTSLFSVSVSLMHWDLPWGGDRTLKSVPLAQPLTRQGCVYR